ncbi:PBP1A family penicillin-binding protein [Brevibacillus sp. 179-C9.3 HS]|uniref:PBP1A family penicillin-binding protein n=1 Tax=unclassified Brevibacillus TaxID=2684853 RepID=UPI00399F3643
MAAKAKKKVRKKKNNLLMIAVSFAIFLFLSVIGGYFALLYAGDRMIEQNVQKLNDLKAEPTVIYDKNGQEMTSLIRQKNRIYKPINEMPKILINAFLAVEDKRFYEHKGVDMIRIGGAIVNDIKKGSLAEGGSTITQQLARNVFLTLDQTFWRKTKEMSIAIGLERKYSKDQILEMYLNRVYLGEGEFGVEDAAKYYFGKSVSDEKFTIAEAAMLAAIPKAPTTYSPFNNPEKAKLRRDTVIRLMHEQGIITEEQKEAAQAEPLPTEPHEVAGASLKKGYRAFFDHMVEESEAQFGVTEEEMYRGGWNIYTTFDPKVQDAMVEEYANAKNFPKDGAKRGVESAMIVIDAKTGGIAGMVGGRNYAAKGFNYATDMKRQPGSSFKPIAVFAPAVNKDINKWNSNSQLSNKRQSFNGYEPRNYNNRYSETMSMNRAMIDSANIPPVWLLNEIGVTESLEYLKKVGIELTPNDRNLAIALGGLSTGTSPMEMAQAYTPFVNGGVVSETHSITKVENKDEGVVREYKPKQTEALKPEAAWEVHTMLEKAVQEGTGKAARISGRHVAGKTGTTQSMAGDGKANKDAWFVGYTPEYVGAVWMGFDPEDKQHLMRQGSSMTAQMFSKVLATSLKGVPSTDFVKPAGVVEQKPVEVEPAIQLAADMTLDNNQLKVVLSWIGGAEGDTYDLYRISENGERQLIAEGMKETLFVDVLDSPKQYRYQVVPRNAQGEEGTPSPEVPIDSKKLENLINDDPGHNEDGSDQGQNPEGTEDGNGEIPPDQGTGENGEHTNNGDGSQSPNPGTGEVPPDIMTPDPSQTDGSSNEIQLPPPPQEEGQNQFPDASNG